MEAVRATTPSIKVSETVKAFSGDDGADVCAWVQKIELVSRLTGVKDLASFLPLYLEGSALAVYLELSDGEKENVETMKRRLLEAFSDSRFTAYCKLKAARWTGEAVDVFANDIRRLARESGFTKDGLEEIVKLAFITGFPDRISTELQQIHGIDGMRVSEVLGRARVLASRSSTESIQGVVASSFDTRVKGGNKEKVQCHKCSGPHFVRDCPEIKCYNCGKGGHMADRCRFRGNQSSRRSTNHDDFEDGKSKNVCAVAKGTSICSVTRGHKVPLIKVIINGKSCQAMVDTGCTMSLVKSSLVSRWSGESAMVAFDGHVVKCKGLTDVALTVGGVQITAVVIVVDQIVGDVEVVVGMDVIQQLGGVLVHSDRVQFGGMGCSVSCSFQEVGPIGEGGSQQDHIVDKDFEAWFDGKRWIVKYFWKNGQEPRLTNKVALYDHGLEEATEEAFNLEVQRWIDEGILVKWSGEVNGIIPLMEVEQVTKNKVRPVMDFRELNEFVECHTGGDTLDVCSDRLREWRRIEGDTEIVDLKSAYFQVHVASELWQHQLVRFKATVYALTRLGFGLNSAPKIMSRILKTVLAKKPAVRKAISSYIDDIMMDVTSIAAKDVVTHLKTNGLVAKDPEKLDEGAVLGLRLRKNGEGDLMFSRANGIPMVEELTIRLTKREVFSICGKLVGHYPVAGWLRVACSFVKRQTEGMRWDDFAGEKVCSLLREMVDLVHKEDPVKGRWKVPNETNGIVWCDASDLPLGVVVEIGGVVVEDSAWMRKKDYWNHINVAELESAVKGVNLGVQWGLKDIMLMTDSATVAGWIKTTLSEERKVKTKGAAEVLIKRRLGVLKSLIEELGLTVTVVWVASAVNKADKLTRVKRGWLHEGVMSSFCAASVCDVKSLHERHHFGVERTWYLARQVDPSVSKETVKKVVRECVRCQSIDPASVSHEPGELGIDRNWTRLAIDVTHYHGLPYLTVVDCGPGRFVIWRELQNETASLICRELEQIFRERGPVNEVLLDNATVFKSREMVDFLQRWNTSPFYRAAYRASGNGIVERNHRTIKAIAERGLVCPMEAVFWYNLSPKNRQQEETVPQRSVFCYSWRNPDVEPQHESQAKESSLSIGDEVWVKPVSGRCTAQWEKGEVSKINSRNNIEVDGVPRHMLDVRPVVTPQDHDAELLTELETVDER